jgi:hypothetical protein
MFTRSKLRDLQSRLDLFPNFLSNLGAVCRETLGYPKVRHKGGDSGAAIGNKSFEVF